MLHIRIVTGCESGKRLGAWNDTLPLKSARQSPIAASCAACGRPEPGRS